MDEQQREERQPPPEEQQPPTGVPAHFGRTTTLLILLVLVALALIFAAFSWLVLSREGAINQATLYLYIGLFSFLTMLVMFGVFSTSTAQVWGQKAGINFRMVGPPAAFFLAFLVFWEMAPGPDTKTVQVILTEGGQQVDGEFRIVPTIGGVDGAERQSQNNQATLQIPGHVMQIDGIVLKKPGYSLKDKPPFKIQSNVLKLDVMKTAEGPPAHPNTRRDPKAVFDDLPTADDVEKAGVYKAEECGLFYRNITDDKLRLLILDCSRYYRIKANDSDEQPWMDWPFDPSMEFAYYQRFADSTGWYCFAVIDDKGDVHALKPSAKNNLCKHKLNKMTVSSPREGEFEVAWEVGKEGERP